MSAIELFKTRRTQYALNNTLPVSQEAVVQLVQTAVREAPSSFNSQSSRVVILFGAAHQKLWNDLTVEALRPHVSAEQLATTAQKLANFAAGAGTVLFFEDRNVIEGLQEKFALYADKFPEFSAHSAGMAQFAVWTALAEAKIGASLQHYSPLVDDAVRTTWNLPESWVLNAQMPFGGHAGAIGEKSYMDDAQRFRVFEA